MGQVGEEFPKGSFRAKYDTPRMQGLIAKIDALIEEKSLLKHPFYQKWSEGSLTVESLAGYSREYYEMARSVPGFVESIITHAPDDMDTSVMKSVMDEESEHVSMWAKFASAFGVKCSALESDARSKTVRAVTKLGSLMKTFEGGACAMYAFEKEIPSISRTKLDGLAEFYGITSDDATEYLRIHTEADIRHAAVWSGVVEASAQPAAMITVAGASLDAQNLLLDSCYEAYC